MKHIAHNKFALFGVITSCFLLSGCSKEDKSVHEDGFFRYIYVESRQSQNKKNKTIAIVGLTALGREQVTLDIPYEINDCPVSRIGYYHYQYAGNLEEHIFRCGESLKRIFIHSNIKFIQRFEGKGVELMICSSLSMPDRDAYVKAGSTYFCKHLYTELGYDDPNDQSAAHLADVAFLNNYELDSKETIYRVDNLNSDNKIDLPPEPVRDGYSFTGWYTEPECTNAWDFNVVPSTNEEDQLNLYAGWKIA